MSMKPNEMSRIDAVIERIEKEHVSIRPRSLVVIGSILAGAGVAIVASAGSLFMTVGVYRMRALLPWSESVPDAISSIPWLMLGAGLVFTFWGFRIVRRYHAVYTMSFRMVLILGIVALGTVAFVFDALEIADHPVVLRTMRALQYSSFRPERGVGYVQVDEQGVPTSIIDLEGRSHPLGPMMATSTLREAYEDGQLVHISGSSSVDAFVAHRIEKHKGIRMKYCAGRTCSIGKSRPNPILH